MGRLRHAWPFRAGRGKLRAKRRLGIAPGKVWIPWDQVDFGLAALILVGRQAALSSADVAINVILPCPAYHM